MKVYFTKSFKKSYKSRILKYSKLAVQFEKRYNFFIDDPTQSILRDHALAGKMKGYRSFSVTGDIRVIYYIHRGVVYFIDIGTHNQVY